MSYAERENNRPKVNGFVSNYWYDADGERTVKTSGEGEQIYVNSEFAGGRTNTAKFSLYVSPYLVSNQGGRYTKHIYIGSQRVVSKIGDFDFYGSDPRRIPYAGSEADAVNVDYKGKYASQQQVIKDNYATFNVPYNGEDNNDYVDGEGFCCNYGTLEAAQAKAMAAKVAGAKANNFHDADSYEKMQFYYHPDHLGSSSYITNLDGEVAQHIEYVPFGEVFIEERNNTWNTPYLFNAKEFDEETGLYYYGARYMNPVTNLWYGVDPLAEKYVATGGYVYTLDNPVRLIDPNGNWSWPWERGSLIEYRGNGVFGIRIENFSKTMQSNFKRANNNPANWRPGELGINTEIGKISVDNYAHKSFTIGRKPAGIDPKDGNVRIRRPIAKSTGQEDRRFHSFDPMPVRGSAKAVGAIAILDFANYAVDTYMTLSTFWDSNAFDDQMASFRKAIRAVNSQMNSIPDNYRKDTNKMGAILNYVFQGENTTKDKNIDKIGQNILSKSGRYDRTNKTYKTFIKR